MQGKRYMLSLTWNAPEEAFGDKKQILQYGTGGKMQGKRYMLSLTWNAPEEAFEDKKQILFKGNSVDEVFIANTSVYKFCGAEILPSFSCHDVMKNPDIEGQSYLIK